MKSSAIILSGGYSKRFGKDKGLVTFAGKPMILNVYEKVAPHVDEVIVVVSSEAQLKKYKRLMRFLNIIVDECFIQGPIAGALTGFNIVNNKYSMLLSCDTPLLSEKIISLLLEKKANYDAVIPRWPNNYIEPLQAIYETKKAYKSAIDCIAKGKLRMLDIVSSLNDILYISTFTLRRLDPNLHTFLNINTLSDLVKAENILKTIQ